jgi:hypothetical protein
MAHGWSRRCCWARCCPRDWSAAQLPQRRPGSSSLWCLPAAVLLPPGQALITPAPGGGDLLPTGLVCGETVRKEPSSHCRPIPGPCPSRRSPGQSRSAAGPGPIRRSRDSRADLRYLASANWRKVMLANPVLIRQAPCPLPELGKHGAWRYSRLLGRTVPPWHTPDAAPALGAREDEAARPNAALGKGLMGINIGRPELGRMPVIPASLAYAI